MMMNLIHQDQQFEAERDDAERDDTEQGDGEAEEVYTIVRS